MNQASGLISIELREAQEYDFDGICALADKHPDLPKLTLKGLRRWQRRYDDHQLLIAIHKNAVVVFTMLEKRGKTAHVSRYGIAQLFNKQTLTRLCFDELKKQAKKANSFWHDAEGIEVYVPIEDSETPDCLKPIGFHDHVDITADKLPHLWCNGMMLQPLRCAIER